jgi:hypothetical protein
VDHKIRRYKKYFKNRRAQVALWVIVAIVIVGIIALMFYLYKGPSITPVAEEVNIQLSIKKCARDAVNEAVDKMLPQGGFIEPENYKVYKNIEVTYLCQNIGYFKPCINQHPMFLSEEIDEIKITLNL